MKRIKSLKNEEAVSPVIGVILMVVITVIIAAVLAAFAFGIGSPSKTPTASIKVIRADTTAGTITLEHQGGDPLVWVDVQFIVVDNAGLRGLAGVTPQELTANTFFEPGEGATLDFAGLTVAPGDRITIVVTDVPSGKEILNSQIIAS